MGHFLQGEAWARLQADLGREGVELSGDGWRVRAYVEKGKLNSRLYAPYGPELDRPEALVPAVDALRREAKRLGTAFLRVEPTLVGGRAPQQQPALEPAVLEAAGLRRVERKQPEHTQRLDLQRPFDEVLADMQSSLRNRHRNFAKKGMSVRRSDDPADVEHLIRILGDVADRTGMHSHDSDYLRANAGALMPGGDACIYLVDLVDAELPIAASLVFDDERCRYYAHAAADNEHRKLQPGPILVTSMIQAAHEAGQAEFDLYGVVPPEVRDHAWTGFSDFKRSFGGHQVDYSGTWELPVKRLSYGVYTAARRYIG